MESRNSILIMGAGTVGSRIGDILLSLDPAIEVAFCKSDARMDGKIPGEFEIKTRELQEVCARYPGRKIAVYAAAGPDLDRRVDNLRRAGLPCRGGIAELDFRTVALAIDTSNGAEVANEAAYYRPHGIPAAFVGGPRRGLPDSRVYAGVPNSVVDADPETYRSGNVTVVSCNTHCIITALGMLKRVTGGEDFRRLVRHIDITFCRRHEDPHRGVPKPEFVSLALKPYHVQEVEALLPETAGLLTTTVSKWPTEYFHTVIINVEFHAPLSSELVADYLAALEQYDRCIVTEGAVDHQQTIEAAWRAGIRDGDIPFPVFRAARAGRYTLKVLALTPQRGIVAPSTADLALFRTGRARSWREAFAQVNAHGRYRGHPFGLIKRVMEEHLGVGELVGMKPA